MRHQPAGEGLRHLVEVFIRSHTFGEKGVGHQQGNRLVESATQLLMDLPRECCGRYKAALGQERKSEALPNSVRYAV